MNKEEEKKMNLPTAISDCITANQINDIKDTDWKQLGKESLINAFNLIPYAGGFIASEVASIRDFRQQNFFRKFLRFVYEIKDTSEKDRKEFIDDVEKATDDSSGNIIADMIDRTDNINKIVILSNLVKAKIAKQISIEDFFRLSLVVEKIPYTDFKYLKKFETQNYLGGGITEELNSAGVLFPTLIDANRGNKYVLTDLGSRLVFYGLGLEVEISEKLRTIVPAYLD